MKWENHLKARICKSKPSLALYEFINPYKLHFFLPLPGGNLAPKINRSEIQTH
jgi:hypothetical protein